MRGPRAGRGRGARELPGRGLTEAALAPLVLPLPERAPPSFPVGVRATPLPPPAPAKRRARLPRPRHLTTLHPKAQFEGCFWEAASDSRF